MQIPTTPLRNSTVVRVSTARRSTGWLELGGGAVELLDRVNLRHNSLWKARRRTLTA